MRIPEVILTTSDTDHQSHALDLDTATELASYKPCNTVQGGISLLGDDMFIASHAKQGYLYVWSWNREQPHVKCLCAEKIGPVVCTNDGVYAIGGAESGKIYVWRVATGTIVRSFDAHLRKVNRLSITPDDDLLVSVGGDAVIHVWSVPAIVAGDHTTANGLPIELRPRITWSEHALSVTDFHIPSIAGGRAACVSVSADRTCKLWNLNTLTIITSVTFPTELQSVTADPLFHHIYTGGVNGNIYKISATTPPSNKQVEQGLMTFKGHSDAVLTLAMSGDGTTLVSGSRDNTAIVWDAHAIQLVRTISLHKSPVTSVLIFPRPLSLKASKLMAAKLAPVLGFKRGLDDKQEPIKVKLRGNIRIAQHSGDPVKSKDNDADDTVTQSGLEAQLAKANEDRDRLTAAANRMYEFVVNKKRTGK